MKVRQFAFCQTLRALNRRAEDGFSLDLRNADYNGTASPFESPRSNGPMSPEQKEMAARRRKAARDRRKHDPYYIKDSGSVRLAPHATAAPPRSQRTEVAPARLTAATASTWMTSPSSKRTSICRNVRETKRAACRTLLTLCGWFRSGGPGAARRSRPE